MIVHWRIIIKSSLYNLNILLISSGVAGEEHHKSTMVISVAINHRNDGSPFREI